MTHTFLSFLERHIRLLAILLVLVVVFGWFAVRPAILSSVCNSKMDAINQKYKTEGSPLTMTQLRFDYEFCLHGYGL